MTIEGIELTPDEQAVLTSAETSLSYPRARSGWTQEQVNALYSRRGSVPVEMARDIMLAVQLDPNLVLIFIQDLGVKLGAWLSLLVKIDLAKTVWASRETING